MGKWRKNQNVQKKRRTREGDGRKAIICLRVCRVKMWCCRGIVWIYQCCLQHLEHGSMGEFGQGNDSNDLVKETLIVSVILLESGWFKEDAELRTEGEELGWHKNGITAKDPNTQSATECWSRKEHQIKFEPSRDEEDGRFRERYLVISSHSHFHQMYPKCIRTIKDENRGYHMISGVETLGKRIADYFLLKTALIAQEAQNKGKLRRCWFVGRIYSWLMVTDNWLPYPRLRCFQVMPTEDRSGKQRKQIDPHFFPAILQIHPHLVLLEKYLSEFTVILTDGRLYISYSWCKWRENYNCLLLCFHRSSLASPLWPVHPFHSLISCANFLPSLTLYSRSIFYFCTSEWRNTPADEYDASAAWCSTGWTERFIPCASR